MFNNPLPILESGNAAVFLGQIFACVIDCNQRCFFPAINRVQQLCI